MDLFSTLSPTLVVSVRCEREKGWWCRSFLYTRLDVRVHVLYTIDLPARYIRVRTIMINAGMYMCGVRTIFNDITAAVNDCPGFSYY